MRFGLKVNGVIATLLLAACGGSDSPTNVSATPAPSSGTTAPAPGASPTPAAPTPAAPTPAAPTPAAPTPAAPAPSAPVNGSATTLPTGDTTGGAADVTTSGYKDTLLTGRWEVNPGDNPEPPVGACLDIPAQICGTAFSIKFAEYGFIANGLAANEIQRLEIYAGAACASTSRSVIEVSRPIQFKAADTVIDDGRPGAVAGAKIAVREGDYGDNEEVKTIESGFVPADCDVPGTPVTTPEPAPEACADTLSLRLEPVNGLPRLFKEDTFNCQPGTTKPAAKYVTRWTQTEGSRKR